MTEKKKTWWAHALYRPLSNKANLPKINSNSEARTGKDNRKARLLEKMDRQEVPKKEVS